MTWLASLAAPSPSRAAPREHKPEKVSTTYLFRDPVKRREQMRLVMQRRRARLRRLKA